ncbi:MAG: DUF4157 domain-containing protein [Chloroflexota bacterium]
MVHRKASGNHAGDEAPPIVHDVLRSPGRPLDPATRAFMEPRFGHDFNHVRVHTGSSAAQSARAVNSHAYTVGRHVVFGAGQYSPGTTAGRALLAHELTHVVQQGGASSTQTRLQVGESRDSYEREAAHVARDVTSGPDNFGSRIAPAGQGQIAEDEEPFTQTVGPMAHSTPVQRLQRAANFVAGPFHSVWNIAARIAAGNFALGFTPPVLNGNRIMSAADAVAAINSPTIRSRTPGMPTTPVGATAGVGPRGEIIDPIHDPLVEAYRRQRGLPPEGVDEFGRPVGPSAAEIKYGGLLPDVECWVESVPTNTASFEMFLPTAGPWSTATTKSNVAALISGLGLAAPASCSGAIGATTFSINGQPSDADLVTNVRTHENRHATDHEAVFNAVAVPWDAALTAANTSNRIFREPGVSGCEAALYAAAGGTPEQIARRLWSGWVGANNAFHASPAGAAAQPSNPQANADCSASSLDVTA